MTLADFLFARIADLQDEAMAHPDPDWVLAECDAKTEIVRALSRSTIMLSGSAARAVADADRDLVFRHLALPYADHSDYREEWKP